MTAFFDSLGEPTSPCTIGGKVRVGVRVRLWLGLLHTVHIPGSGWGRVRVN